jgi:predicted dehydrogenase
MVEYLQDWLMDPLEKTGQKQAAWRVDPERAGISCCVGDIGTHCENLLAFITGLRVESVCADLTTFVGGRRLDDDASVLLRMEKGARGHLSCSQVSCGEGNNLNIRIYGTKAGLEWHQQEPNTLVVKPAGKPWEHWYRGARYMGEDAKALTRTPLGHPEGYLEAFASLYKMVATDIRRVKAGEAPLGGYPTVRDGLRGIQFVVSTVESAKKGATWVDMPRG